MTLYAIIKKFYICNFLNIIWNELMNRVVSINNFLFKIDAFPRMLIKIM